MDNCTIFAFFKYLKPAIYLNNVEKSFLYHTENTVRFLYETQLVKVL
jgi:hypothetical protein